MMIDLIFMHIIIIPYQIPNNTFKLIKIFCFKFFKINLNTILQTKIFNTCSYILINFICYIFIDHIIVSYLKV